MAWARLLDGSHVLLTCSIAVAAGVLLFGREQLVAAIRTGGGTGASLHWRRCLGLHFVALLAFFALTWVLFRHPPTRASVGIACIGLWASTGLVCLAAALCVALSERVWIALLRRGTAGLLLGVGVGVLAWMAGQESGVRFWNLLGDSTLHCVYTLLSHISDRAVLDVGESVTGTVDFLVRVDVGCAGYEGIGLVWIFLSVYLWVSREKLRFPAAFLLLPIATAVVWCANVLRIFALILIGDAWSPELAIGSFHTRVGWVLFCALALATVAVAEHSAFFARRDHGAPRESRRPALLFVAPLLLVLGVQLVGGAVVTDPSEVYPLAMLCGLAALLCFRRELASAELSWSWSAVVAGGLVFAVWTAFELDGAAVTSRSAVLAASGPSSTLTSVVSIGLAQIIGAVFVVPIVEELAFRGYLSRRLVAADFTRIPLGTFTLFSFATSSLLFGLAHDRWLVGTFAGLIYAGVFWHRRQLSHAILAHAVTNGLLVAQAGAL